MQEVRHKARFVKKSSLGAWIAHKRKIFNVFFNQPKESNMDKQYLLRTPRGAMFAVVFAAAMYSLTGCGSGGSDSSTTATTETAASNNCGNSEKSIIFKDEKGVNNTSCHAQPGVNWAFNDQWGWYALNGEKFATTGNKILSYYDLPSAQVDAEVLTDKKVTMAKSPNGLFAIFKGSTGFWYFKEVSTTSRISLNPSSPSMTNGSGTGITDLRTVKVNTIGLLYLDGAGICRQLQKNSANQWDQVRIATTDC